ncbi:hypothetical protein V5799_022091 [Amblyomma americanum]|uniref:Uncharacterized protein n=1 Tax=Amblyomma americanum TaxID=6943 RepID=A0AAQ4FNW2_AMBAM
MDRLCGNCTRGRRSTESFPTSGKPTDRLVFLASDACRATACHRLCCICHRVHEFFVRPVTHELGTENR